MELDRFNRYEEVRFLYRTHTSPTITLMTFIRISSIVQGLYRDAWPNLTRPMVILVSILYRIA